MLFPSYHDVSQETEPECSKENKNKNKPKKENNIKWKNMRTRWLILHGSFDPDVISSKGFSLTTLWKSIPSIINYSLVSETCSVFFTELTTLWHYFLFFLLETQTRMSDPWKQCLDPISLVLRVVCGTELCSINNCWMSEHRWLLKFLENFERWVY